MPRVSSPVLSRPIRSSGATASKFRSKMISEGWVFAFSITVSESCTNSSSIPERLAASVIFTEKKRSLTTARTRLGSRFSIDVLRLEKNLTLSDEDDQLNSIMDHMDVHSY